MGNGLDIRDSSGPRSSGFSVVEDVTQSSVIFRNTTPGTEEVLTGSSTRDIAYYKSGWAGQTTLAAGFPFLTRNEGSGCVSITGRLLYSMCQMTLNDKVRPHADLVNAVESALAQDTAEERQSAMKRVFDRYGYAYAASVELGGMKSVTRFESAGQEVSLCLAYSNHSSRE